MLEIKCPKSRIITGFIPEVYQAQIQGQLEVCDLEYCDFLECDFQIYDTKRDFLDDFYMKDDIVNAFKTKNNMEKGLIFETYNTITKSYSYEYSNIEFRTLEDIDNWESPFIDKILDSEHLEHAGTTCWYLNEYSVVLVKRDKEWFNTNFIKIKNFWNSVEYARINGIPDKKKKENKKIESSILSNFANFKNTKSNNVNLNANTATNTDTNTATNTASNTNTDTATDTATNTINIAEFVGSEKAKKSSEFIIDFNAN